MQLGPRAEGARVHQRDAAGHRGVVDGELGGDRVGAVEDDVEVVEQRGQVGVEAGLERAHAQRRVDRAQPVGRGVDLRTVEVRFAVERLSVQVRDLDAVGIDQAERPHAGFRQDPRGRGAEAADTDDERPRSSEGWGG